MEFLELVETIRAEEADAQRLLRGDGDGARSAKVQARAKHMGRLVEATELVAKAFSGNRWALLTLQEAMTTSDFPLLFADVLDRQVLQAYREAPQHWQSVAKRSEVRDFRQVKRFPRGVGGESYLSTVAEQAQYPESSIADSTPYTYTVQKYGRRMPFAWETLINDDLDLLKDTPERFGRAARATEERFATMLYADSNGPHASLYTVGNTNIVNTTNGGTVDNIPLSIQGLQDAMLIIGKAVDGNGNPIVIDLVTLVVPPALAIIAQNIMNAIELRLTRAGGITDGSGADQELITTNWMRNRMQLVVNPWLPIISTTNGNTSWYLFASPASGPAALEMGFLRGYSEPQVFVKAPNQSYVGGGAPDAMAGDFDTDSVQYKVRHIMGGTRLDPKMTVASNGSSA